LAAKRHKEKLDGITGFFTTKNTKIRRILPKRLDSFGRDYGIFGHEGTKGTKKYLIADYADSDRFCFSQLGVLCKFNSQSKLCYRILPSSTRSFCNARFVKPGKKGVLNRGLHGLKRFFWWFFELTGKKNWGILGAAKREGIGGKSVARCLSLVAREGNDSAIGGFSIGIIDYLDAGLEN